MIADAPPFLAALDLRDKPVVVIGSGEEARSRAEAFVTAGALISLIVPAPDPELESWAQRCAIETTVREPQASDLSGKWLAVLTDRNPDRAARFGQLARQAGVFFCAIDQPEWNSFSHVAIVRAGSLQLGISSGGRAPAVAAGLRREFARIFTEADLASFVERFADLRDRLDPSQRIQRLRSLAAEIRLMGSLNLPTWAEGEHNSPQKREPSTKP